MPEVHEGADPLESCRRLVQLPWLLRRPSCNSEALQFQSPGDEAENVENDLTDASPATSIVTSSGGTSAHPHTAAAHCKIAGRNDR
mmetsp:Transcript_42795/g.118214  ORF Transcript_42795/g.118214 Transcript_42795/m.118214 type:complete len:86 (-) Transcript_42795:158-415(-)